VYADDQLPSSNGSSHAAAANGHAAKQAAEVEHGTADTPHNDQQEGSREQQQQHSGAEPSSNGSAAAGGSDPASGSSGSAGVAPSAVLAHLQRAYKVAEEQCGAPPQLLLVLLPDTSPARYKVSRRRRAQPRHAPDTPTPVAMCSMCTDYLQACTLLCAPAPPC
jgi:hypothetical protein